MMSVPASSSRDLYLLQNSSVSVRIYDLTRKLPDDIGSETSQELSQFAMSSGILNPIL